MLVKFKNTNDPREILEGFASMAKKSKSLDGDWQGDGFGVAWQEKNGTWQEKRSLKPIWESEEILASIPKTSFLVAHARSASFPSHKGNIEFNQPFVDDGRVFVFNGLLRGVSLPGIPGKIGAQKIWHLLKGELKENSPQNALEKVKEKLIKNSRDISALNIGLVSGDEIYSLNYFSKSPQYYSLYKWKTEQAEILCSEKF